jgi:uncharacterized protein involved in response to NO
MLPVSAGLEFTAFLIFFFTVARHRAPRESSESKDKRSVWMFVVVISTVGFLASLSVNMAVAVRGVIANSGVAIEHGLDERLLPLYTWGFPVLAIWGFSARCLPVFLGRPHPSNRLLLMAAALDVAGVAAALAGWFHIATILAAIAAGLSVAALRIFPLYGWVTQRALLDEELG